MFIVTLPYSKKEFVIPVITFKDLLELSRLVYDNNTEGLVRTIDTIFNLDGLSIIDKFFVIVKTRQYYISESVNLNLGSKSVSVNVSNFTNNLYGIESKHKIINLGDQQIEIDIPYKFITDNRLDNIYENIIKSITIGNNTIDLSNCTSTNIQSLLEILPPSVITHLKKFITCSSHNIEIFSTRDNNQDNLYINFVTSQPYDFITLLLGDYDLISCREILFFLSKRMNSETVLNSPVSDVVFYLKQYQDEIKRNNDSGNSELGL